MIILWALVLGTAAGLFWCGCGPAQLKRPTPASIRTTYTAPDPCRTLLNIETANVHVVIQKDCARVGLTTALFIVKNIKDGGKAAADEAGQILIRFFEGPPTLAPITITTTPTGEPVYLFAVTAIPPKTIKRIERDMRLRKRMLPK